MAGDGSPRAPRSRTMKPRRAGTRMSTRERLMLLGPDQVSEVELLALLLGGDRALERAMDLLTAMGGLWPMQHASPRRLSRQPGVGPDGAAVIVTAIELGRRIGRLSLRHATKIDGPADVALYLQNAIGRSPQERFVVLGLDVHRRLLMVRTVAVGSLAAVQVQPREVFRPLVEAGMHSVVLAHNHPSGEAEPSDADLILTHRLAHVGELVGIEVLDHLIVTRGAVTSLAEHGFLASSRWGGRTSCRIGVRGELASTDEATGPPEDVRAIHRLGSRRACTRRLSGKGQPDRSAP